MDFSTSFKVPMSSPDLTDLEVQAVLSVARTTSLSMGPKAVAFEQAFCRHTGLPHALAVNSGTAGLHLSVLAAGVKEGDLVLTTPYSFVASANAILYERAVPVFVDVDPLTGNIDPNHVAAAAEELAQGNSSAERWLPRRGLSRQGALKAILAVDVFGQAADYDPLRQTAKTHQLVLIEDACELLGAEYKGRKTGTLGDIAVFAFYPNKQITTGEGGVVVTADEQMASMVASLRNQGRAPGDTWLQHTYLGYNYRLDELSCALGAAQMSRLEELLAARTRVAGWYHSRLMSVAGIELPDNNLAADTTRASWFVYVIRLPLEVDRNELIGRLAAAGIPSRPYFSPIHLQPYMVKRFGYQRGDFPVAEELGEHGLALPFFGKMSEDQVDLVCQELKTSL